MNATELMRQASDTAHDYLRRARDDAGELFPNTTAEQRVSLAIALMQTAAQDFATIHLGQIVDRVGEDLANGLHALAKAGATRELSDPWDDEPGVPCDEPTDGEIFAAAMAGMDEIIAELCGEGDPKP